MINYHFISGQRSLSYSAGVGRTGCFLLVDMVVRALEAGVDRVHPVTMLKRLREQRAHLVQKPEQWAYVNKCVRDAIQRRCMLTSALTFGLLRFLILYAIELLYEQ